MSPSPVRVVALVPHRDRASAHELARRAAPVLAARGVTVRVPAEEAQRAGLTEFAAAPDELTEELEVAISLGGERAHIGALERGHSRIGAHRPRQLTVPDVDRHDGGNAALEETVGEAAGGCARVERTTAGDGDRERVEGGRELFAAARHEARRRTLHVDRFLGCNQSSGA